MQPPYGGINRIRFEGYVSLHPEKLPHGDPWRAAKVAEMWNNCKARPHLTY